ncbi:hypothetical protein Tco_1234643 [Tanacetum coccineum]
MERMSMDDLSDQKREPDSETLADVYLSNNGTKWVSWTPRECLGSNGLVCDLKQPDLNNDLQMNNGVGPEVGWVWALHNASRQESLVIGEHLEERLYPMKIHGMLLGSSLCWE